MCPSDLKRGDVALSGHLDPHPEERRCFSPWFSAASASSSYLLAFVASISWPPLPSHEAAICWAVLSIAVGLRYRLSETSSAVFASLPMSGVRPFIMCLFKHLLSSSGIYTVHIKLPALMKLMDMVLAKSTVMAGTSCGCLGST